jgi:DNA-binding transcriptional LysR family regulator
VVRNVCNRLAGFEPDVRHRSDDGLVLGALVASGRAVALLPALLAAAMPQIVARRLREERQRDLDALA